MKSQVSFRLLQRTKSPNETSSRLGLSTSKFAFSRTGSESYAKRLDELPSTAARHRAESKKDPRIDILEKVQLLDNIRKQRCRITPQTLKLILELMEGLVVPNSVYQDLMAWMLQCLNQHIFLTDADKKDLAPMVQELRLAEMSNCEMSYRKLAVLLKELLEAEDKIDSEVATPKPKIMNGYGTSINGIISVPAPIISDKESPISSSQHSPLLQPRKSKSKKAIPYLRSTDYMMSPLKTGTKLLLTSAEDSHQLPVKSRRDSCRNQSSLQAIDQFNESAREVQANRIDDLENERKELKEKAQSLYSLNNKLTSEIGRLIDENTGLKHQYADCKISLFKEHGEQMTVVKGENQELSAKIDSLLEELASSQARCRQLEDVASELKRHISTLVHVSSTTSDRLSRLLSGRDGVDGIKLIREPDLKKLSLKLGFAELDVEFSNEDTFVDKLEKLIKRAMTQKNPRKMITRQENTSIESKSALRKPLAPSHSSVGLNNKIFRKGSFNTLTLRSPTKQFTSKDTLQSNLHPLNTFKTIRLAINHHDTIQEQEINDASASDDNDDCHQSTYIDSLIRDVTAGLMPAIDNIVNAMNKL